MRSPRRPIQIAAAGPRPSRTPIRLAPSLIRASRPVLPRDMRAEELLRGPNRSDRTRAGNPYVDYARQFTATGSVLLTFKRRDERGWRLAIRIALWILTVAAGLDWIDTRAFTLPPLTNVLLLTGLGALSWWILFVQDQIAGTLEVREDCLIVDDDGVFWRAEMETMPQLQPLDAETWVLTGTVGTRHVEYLRLHAFDENDRQPQVFASHLMAAIGQLWRWPLAEPPV